jgi:predicted nucleotidyltransferase
MIDQALLEKATMLLRDTAKPRRIILFGSLARNEASADSDIDIMVVESVVTDRIAEMVRLGRTLSPLRLPIDLLVVSEEMYDYWSDTPGNIYYLAKTEGRIMYEAA